MDTPEAFCTSLQPELMGTLTLLLGDRGVAEDLTQETLGRVYARWGAVSRMDSPKAWAYRVALNLVRSRWRRLAAERRARARIASRGHVDHHEPDLAEALAVRAAVAALPSRQRTALVLRYWSDLGVDEVAALMGCSPGTVKSSTSRAIASLRHSAGLLPEETAR